MYVLLVNVYMLDRAEIDKKINRVDKRKKNIRLSFPHLNFLGESLNIKLYNCKIKEELNTTLILKYYDVKI